MLQAVFTAALMLVSHITVAYYMAEHRFSKKVTIAIWLAYGALTAALWMLTGEPDDPDIQFVSGYCGALLLQVAVYFITTRGRPGQRIFLLITYVVFFTVSCGISDVFRWHVFASSEDWGSYAMHLLSIALLMWLFLGRLLPLVKKTGKYIERWWPLCGISLLFFAAAVCMTIWPRSMINAAGGDILIYAVFVLIICAVYPVLFGNLKAMAQSSQAKQIGLHRDLLLSEVEAQRAATEAARRARHDLRHHDLLIAEYAKSGDIDGLLAYLGAHEKKEYGMGASYCENETLSHILAIYLKKAQAAGIETDALAQARRDIPLSSADLVAIVANMLENAIHGCGESGAEKPFLRLRIHEKSGKLVIRCENSCKPGLRFTGELPGQLRGIGISSIEDAAARYDGACDFSAEDGVFTCGVLLNMAAGQA